MEYCEFLRTNDAWHWNTKLPEILKQSFITSMLSYSENIMCKLIRLIAYNHVLDEEFLRMVEDALVMRVATCLKQKLPIQINQEAMFCLTEGLYNLGICRKPLIDLVKRLLVEQDENKDNFINLNPNLCLLVLRLFDDFEVPLSDKLHKILNTAVIESHVKHKKFSLSELSYLALSKDLLSEYN